MNELINHKGRHRAARAAKKTNKKTSYPRSNAVGVKTALCALFECAELKQILKMIITINLIKIVINIITIIMMMMIIIIEIVIMIMIKSLTLIPDSRS